MGVKIDRMTVLEARERHGGLRRLVRVADVSGVGADSWDMLTEALDKAGMPQYGSHLTEDTSSNAYDMILVERNPTVLDKGLVRVELVYENMADLEEDLSNPRGGYITGEVRCNTTQKTSNLNIYGNQVTVSHTYPEDDPNHPGETLVQGGEFQYFEPQRSIFIRGIKATRTPWLIANNIVGRVNSFPFSGEAARKWLCTACTWKIAWAGMGNNRYYMNFEFQHDLDGWDPTVTFIDDVTNKPPAGLVPGVGYKTIEKMPQCDFDALIGAPLQGG